MDAGQASRFRPGDRIMKTFIQSLAIIAAVVAATAPASLAGPAPKPKDVCIVNLGSSGSPLNTFVFRDVKPLVPGGAIPLQGLFFTAARKVAPAHGSAAMASDGSVRIGLVVHSSADSTNDFTVSGITAADFSGTLKFDSDGDFKPEGTLVVEPASCAAVPIP
jgi:hypothetical protein